MTTKKFLLRCLVIFIVWLAAIMVAVLLYGTEIKRVAAQEDTFVIRYYLSPVVDQFADNPDIDRESWVSKVKLYLSGEEGHSSAQLPNPWKMWTLSEVNASEATHNAIQADPEILLVPLWDSTDVGTRTYLPLTATVSQIDATYRAQIVTYLEARGIPTGWIQGFHTIGRVFRYITQILRTVDRMQENFPEYDLATQLSAIPAQQRSKVEQWMRNHGIDTSDITLAWTVRQVLQRIVDQYPWQPYFKFGGSLL